MGKMEVYRELFFHCWTEVPLTTPRDIIIFSLFVSDLWEKQTHVLWVTDSGN